MLTADCIWLIANSCNQHFCLPRKEKEELKVVESWDEIAPFALAFNEVFIACTIPYFAQFKLSRMLTALMRILHKMTRKMSFAICAISLDDIFTLGRLRAWLVCVDCKLLKRQVRWQKKKWNLMPRFRMAKWLIWSIQVKLIQDFMTSVWRSGKFLDLEREKFHRQDERKKFEMRTKKLCVRFYYNLTTSFGFFFLLFLYFCFPNP